MIRDAMKNGKKEEKLAKIEEILEAVDQEMGRKNESLDRLEKSESKKAISKKKPKGKE